MNLKIMSEELISKLPQLEIRPDDVIEHDTVLASLRNEIGWTEIMTLGNISTLIGKAKSKKTFFMTMLVSGIITNKNHMIQCLASKKRIVIFDTEQAKYHVWKVSKRIEYMVGRWPDTIRIYGLRPLNVQERISEIENYIYLNDLDLVVIDGIRDLVTDINSPEQATDIVGKLMKWSYDRNIHICTILHQNKADDNARGHIGTEVVNKSETVIQIAKAKDKKYSTVSAVYCRGIEPETFQFTIKDNIPIIEVDEYGNYYEPVKEEDDTVPY
jgi:hypothetical protein